MKVLFALLSMFVATSAFAASECSPGQTKTGPNPYSNNGGTRAFYCVYDNNYNEYVWSSSPGDFQKIGGLTNECQLGQTKTAPNPYGKSGATKAFYCVRDLNYGVNVWSTTKADIGGRACAEGAKATGTVNDGYNSHREPISVSVIYVCRNGQWVYDPALNGGFVPRQ